MNEILITIRYESFSSEYHADIAFRNDIKYRASCNLHRLMHEVEGLVKKIMDEDLIK